MICFQVNNKMLVPNLQGRSLISLQIISDSLKYCEGIPSFAITKELILSVRGARARYRSFLDEEARKKASTAVKRRRLPSSDFDMKELREKKAKLMKEISSMENDADHLSLLAETKSCFTTLAKANALRKC